MESFYWKNPRKTSTESAAITEAIYQMCHTKWESTESTLSELFFYFPCQKKLKKPWGQGWVETKLVELNHLLDQKKIAKWKATLNRGALVYYENLPTETHLKKRPIFFVYNRNPLSPS